MGPPERLQEFIEFWMYEASKCAEMIQSDLFPDIQLIPMQEVEEPDNGTK